MSKWHPQFCCSEIGLRASSHVYHTLLYVLHELIECQFRFLEMLVGRESGAKISPLLEFCFISLNTVCLCTFCHHFDWFNFIPFVFVQILLQRHLAFHTSPVKSNLITRSYNAKLEISDIFRATFPKMLMMTLMLHDYPCLSHGVTIPAGQRLSFINLLGV